MHIPKTGGTSVERNDASNPTTWFGNLIAIEDARRGGYGGGKDSKLSKLQSAAHATAALRAACDGRKLVGVWHMTNEQLRHCGIGGIACAARTKVSYMLRDSVAAKRALTNIGSVPCACYSALEPV